MPGPEPERVATTHAMPAACKEALNCRTVPIPRRPRKTRHSATRLTRLRHNALLRRSRPSLPDDAHPQSPGRRLQQ
jgi:hypothetical protein